jgi:hypothetical protein
MTSSSIELTNLRMTNMHFLFAEKGLQVHRVHSDLTSSVRDALIPVFGTLDAEHFSELRKALSSAYRGARSLVASASDKKEFWIEKHTAIEKALGEASQYISEEQFEQYKTVLRAISQLSETDVNELDDALMQLLDDNDSYVFTLNKVLVPYLERRLLEISTPNTVSILRDIHDLKSVGNTSRNLVILDRPRELSLAQRRAILHGGFAPKVIFVAPNWWFGQGDRGLTDDLFEGLGPSFPIEVVVSGPRFSGSATNGNDDIVQPQVAGTGTSELYVYEPGGSVECSYLELAGGLIIPLEEDAERVSVLVQAETGEFRVERVNPFQELKAGDVILELANAAESGFLWDQAAQAMGEDFAAYNDAHDLWYESLQIEKERHGIRALQKLLIEAGVVTANNLVSWLGDPKFTRPVTNADWQKLLDFLGFDVESRQRIVSLTRDFRSTLASVGQKARDALARQVLDEDWQSLKKGEFIRLALSEYGGAEFQLVQFERVGVGSIQCESSEVRRIMKRASNG